MESANDEDIVHFCDVTGANPDLAQNLLRVCDGNVEMAIGLFLENGGTLDFGSASTAAPAVHASVHSPVILGDDDDMMDDDYGQELINSPPRNLPLNTPRNPMAPQRDTLLSDAFQFAGGMASSNSGPDPFGNVPRLADLFAPPRDIMYQQSFDNARIYARQNDLWMIVTLHDPTEFQCQVLNRDLWKDPSIKEVIKASFVFLQLVVETPEGQRYRNFYPTHSLPHIAIIDPRTGERIKEWHHAVSSSEFLVDLMDFMDKHSLNSVHQAEGKKMRVENMSEEEQIALALSASKKELNSQPIVISDDDEVEEANVASNGSTLVQPRERAEIPAGTTDITAIQFRLPDGKRVVRKFLKSDTIRLLFEHIKFAVDELKQTPFELILHREALSQHMEETLAAKNVIGAAINVDYL